MRAVLDTTVAQLAEVCGGTVTSGNGNTKISCITSDSRDTMNDCIFIPLSGEKFDAHDFIMSLIESKSVAAVFSEKDGFENAATEKGIAIIRCDNALATLGKIAQAHRSQSNAKVVAVTGTNGKTTTKEILHAALSKHFNTHKNEKNFNNEIGVPFAVLELAKEHEAAVFELGMNHAGEIDRLSAIVKPNIAIITNAGEGHLEFLGSVENVARAKMEIISGMSKDGLLILNRDSQCFELMLAIAIEAGIKVKTFGIGNNADFYPESYRMGIDFIEVVFSDIVIEAPLYGIHNVYNLIAVFAVLRELEVPMDCLKSAMKNFSLVGGRSQIIDKGFFVINDTYNSNPLSSESAIRSIVEIFPKSKKFAALSDMKELGDAAIECHRKIGSLAAENFNTLCVWGEMADEYLRGASANAHCNTKLFDSKESMAAYIKSHVSKNDVVLVKGSRSMKMEDVTEFLIK